MKLKIILFVLLVSLFLVQTIGYTQQGYNNFTLNLSRNQVQQGYNNFTLVLGEVITPPPAGNDSCTYLGSGNWQISCNDLCNISTNTDLLGNNIQINGTGTVRILANLTNYVNINIFGTDSSNKCIVECNGGCFK